MGSVTVTLWQSPAQWSGAGPRQETREALLCCCSAVWCQILAWSSRRKHQGFWLKVFKWWLFPKPAPCESSWVRDSHPPVPARLFLPFSLGTSGRYRQGSNSAGRVCFCHTSHSLPQPSGASEDIGFMSQKENISLPALPGTDRTWRQGGSVGAITAKQVPRAAVAPRSGALADRTPRGPVSLTAAAICLQEPGPVASPLTLAKPCFCCFHPSQNLPLGERGSPLSPFPTVLTQTQHRCPAEGLCSLCAGSNPCPPPPQSSAEGWSNASNNKYKRQTSFSFLVRTVQ